MPTRHTKSGEDDMLDQLLVQQRYQQKEAFGGCSVFAWEGFAIWKLFTVGLGLLLTWQFWVFIIPGGFLAGLLGIVPYALARGFARVLVLRSRSTVNLQRLGLAAKAGGWVLTGLTIAWALFVASFVWTLIAGARSDIPAKYHKDREAFARSVEALKDASALSEPPTDQTSLRMEPEQERKLFSLVEEGLRLSQRVSNEFLDYLHPQLRSEYRDHLVRSTQLWYEGVKGRDTLKQVLGSQLQLQWIKFWEANNKMIADRAYPE